MEEDEGCKFAYPELLRQLEEETAARWLVGPAANKAKGDKLEDGPLFGKRQGELFE